MALIDPPRLLLLVAFLAGCAQPPAPRTSEAVPWSYRLAAFRYLEPAQAYEGWLVDAAVPAWTTGRDGVDGRWFEVHAGAASAASDLTPVRDRLVRLGVDAPLAVDYREWGADAVAGEDYRLYGYDSDRSPVQLGVALHEVTRAFPCSPRFELVSYAAVQRLESTPRMVREVYEPEGLDPFIDELADADRGTPVVAHAVFRDLPTGDEVEVSMVWREPPSTRQEARARWPGPGFDWSVAPIRGEPRDDGLLVHLLWSPDGALVAAVRGADERGYGLSEALFDRSACRGGAFQYAALWRPLGVLPDGFTAQDRPFAVETGILGDEYVAMKGGARWARRMKGRWHFDQGFLERGENAWAANLFDLETAREAAEVHGSIYTRQMERSWGSGRNRASKRRGGDGIYRSQVLGVPAWYIDHWSRDRLKELNFTNGPWVFAFGSFVVSDAPLRMESLKARAAMLPSLRGS